LFFYSEKVYKYPALDNYINKDDSIMSVKICPDSSFSFFLQQSPAPCGSAGKLDSLSEDVMVLILSKLDTLADASLVCQRMRYLSKIARNEQFLSDGISVAELARICKLSSIEPMCVSILLKFGVDVRSIAHGSDEVILEELNILLKGQLSLLQRPQELSDFLSDSLAENSKKIARYFYGDDALRRPSVFQKMMKHVCACFKNMKLCVASSIKPSSARFKAISNTMAALRGLEAPSSKILVISGSRPAVGGDPTFSMDIGALPPFEVCQRTTIDELTVKCSAVVPSGIGLLRTVRNLFLFNISSQQLPNSIGQLPLQILRIKDCPNLQHFPESLRALTSLTSFGIYQCRPQLLEEIGKWPLEVLRIDCQGLASLPESIQQMSTLKDLVIHGCSPRLLQDIGQLKLEKLGLINPDIERLPECLIEMGTLKTLCIQYTKNMARKLTLDDPVAQRLVEQDATVAIID
jgi:hypothetical protein